MANAQDKHLVNGMCPEKPIRCGPSHGYQVCASKEKEDGSDIINLDVIKLPKDKATKVGKAGGGGGAIEKKKVIKYGGNEYVNGVWDNKCLEF